MKLTLAFDIYNKEHWIQSLLKSWLNNLSGKHECEVMESSTIVGMHLQK